MIYTIETELSSSRYEGKKVVFRIHESGDFYNVEYFRKWAKVAEHFENDDRIIFLAYTKSVAFIKSANVPKNLVLRSSLWVDTCEESLRITRAFDLPIYTAFTAREMDEAEERGEVFERCPCDDCANCGKCWDANIKRIICEIH